MICLDFTSLRHPNLCTDFEIHRTVSAPIEQFSCGAQQLATLFPFLQQNKS
jgi:hypothetical protein